MLMPEPKLILLDEPMAGINPKLIEKVVESIRFANPKFGVSFLVIEHNIDVVTTSESASSCSTRGASWPKGHPTKSFGTRRCGRPISVVDHGKQP